MTLSIDATSKSYENCQLSRIGSFDNMLLYRISADGLDPTGDYWVGFSQSVIQFEEAERLNQKLICEVLCFEKFADLAQLSWAILEEAHMGHGMIDVEGQSETFEEIIQEYKNLNGVE